MSLSAISSLIYSSDVLKETRFKSWRETIRGYCVNVLIVCSLLVKFEMNGSKDIRCVPANHSLKMSKQEVFFINTFCYSTFPWYLRYFEDLLIIVAILFYFGDWWWLTVSGVRKKFTTVRSADDALKQLNLPTEKITEISLSPRKPTQTGKPVDAKLSEVRANITIQQSHIFMQGASSPMFSFPSNIRGKISGEDDIFLIRKSSRDLMSQASSCKVTLVYLLKELSACSFAIIVLFFAWWNLGDIDILFHSKIFDCDGGNATRNLTGVSQFKCLNEFPNKITPAWFVFCFSLVIKVCTNFWTIGRILYHIVVTRGTSMDNKLVLIFSKNMNSLCDATKALMGISYNDLMHTVKSNIGRAIDLKDFDYLRFYLALEEGNRTELKHYLSSNRDRLQEDLPGILTFCFKQKMYEEFYQIHLTRNITTMDQCSCKELDFFSTGTDPDTKCSLLYYVLARRNEDMSAMSVIRHILRCMKNDREAVYVVDNGCKYNAASYIEKQEEEGVWTTEEKDELLDILNQAGQEGNEEAGNAHEEDSEEVPEDGDEDSFERGGNAPEDPVNARRRRN